ncbi:MAG TPA: NAD(P)-dependent alcohol dehydrogenase [Bryobacteraceae bacterium]|jgi:NADPH:quinone reductase-like Zn-dependent oxidoreductase|nr:NAD(P)-dependent alcohol dehydrogenase [Bryobacteraceae bacterium]
MPKAWCYRDAVGAENLRIVELPEPSPGPGEAVVAMRACSLNFRDLAVACGAYGRAVKTPLIPLSDGAGEVVATGPGVTRVKTGDRVAGIFMQKWIGGPVSDEAAGSSLGGAIDGMLAEKVCLNAEGLTHFPEHLSWEEAATLPCAAVTAWNALFRSGGLRPGESVLTQGTGGVSIFALQFASMAGARVIATSGSEAKLDRLRQMGIHEVIDYKTTPEWDKRVREMTSGAGIDPGVDHVIEVGGAGTLPLSIRAVRRGGHIALIGVLTGGGEIDPRPILMKAIRLHGIYVGSREMFEEMNRAIALSGLRPVIDRVFAFDEIAAAMAYMESGAHFGKICVRF